MNQADRYLDDQAEQERQQRAAAEQFQQPMGAYQQPVYQQPVYQQPAYVLQRMASMGEAWSNFWSRWTFAGRASRSEFWLMWVWGLLIGIAFWTITGILTVSDLALSDLALVIIPLSGIFCLAVIIPSLCLQVRRLHDLGYSGWLWWLNFVPVGGLVLFIFFLLPSEPRPNRYGPVPFQYSVRN